MTYRCYQINDHLEWGGYEPGEWFRMSLARFIAIAPSQEMAEYDYVQVVPGSSWARYWSGNDGAQGWRHRMTGWTIPDHCRQSGGTPEVWRKGRRWQLDIAADSPIWSYIVRYE